MTLTTEYLQKKSIGIYINPAVSSRPVPSFLRKTGLGQVHVFHGGVPSYEITPLVELQALSTQLGVKSILVKDESKRFGLNAFKGLGGSYAVYRVICDKLGLAPESTTFQALQTPDRKKAIADMVFSTATDGNHGKGVAWAAGMLGCKAIIYMPAGSSEIRAQAIRDAGQARVTITDMSYDDTVRMAAREARENGWSLVQDTSWKGYETIPAWIVQGYTTLAAEAMQQMKELKTRPTHVFLQAGVGAMAGGIMGYLADGYANQRPIFSVVEPDTVACVYASAQAQDGEPHAVCEPGPTIMAGLNCGEPCTLTWPILRDFSNYYFTCPDFVSAEGMRMLSNPAGKDQPIISGESGAVTFGLVLQLLMNQNLRDIRTHMKLDQNAVILLINTEGDTDPIHYKEIVEKGAYPSPVK